MPPVALVTGAASGIGFAIAQHLYQQGYQLILTDVDLCSAEAAANKLLGRQRLPQKNLLPLSLDVTDAQAMRDCIGVINNNFGRLDVVINNAGIQHVAPLEAFPVDSWRLITDILLVGPALLTRECLPLMRTQNFGRIVNIGSIHSLVASPYKSAYVAAKHGLLGFAKTVALETADQNITINTICPAYVKTQLVEAQITQQAEAHGLTEEQVIEQIMLAPMPKKQFVGMDEICAAVSFLVSPECRTMTGQTVVLDGGWTVQ